MNSRSPTFPIRASKLFNFRNFIKSKRIKIFIVPTWFCLVFNIFLLGLMGFGFSKHNISVVGCCFVVLFIELLSMIEAHVNLRDLECSIDDVKPVETSSIVSIALACRSLSQSFGVGFYAVDSDSVLSKRRFSILPRGFESYARREVYESFFGFLSNSQVQNLQEHLISQNKMAIPVSFKANFRGVRPVPKFIAVSMFPFGMFRVWREFVFDQKYISYPIPKGAPYQEVLIKGNQSHFKYENDSGQLKSIIESEYSHHDDYKFGDSMRRIDWRASSRKGSKIVKVFSSQTSYRQRILRWSDTIGEDGEARLSQLSEWVHAASRNRVPFMLDLPGVKTKFGLNNHHFIHCLSVLADYDLKVMGPGGRL